MDFMRLGCQPEALIRQAIGAKSLVNVTVALRMAAASFRFGPGYQPTEGMMT